METVAYIILLGVLIWSPLAFGTVHLISQTVMSLGVFAASVLLAIKSVNMDRKAGAWQVQLPATNLNLLFLLFLFFLLFQLVPLPESLLKLLSPEAWIVAQKSSPASQAVAELGATVKWAATGIYSSPVRESLVLWLTYGLFFFSLCRLLNTRKRIDAAILVILILGCFETLYGMGQTFTGSDAIWWYKKSSHSDVSGTYVNRNHFAGLMGMIMMLGVLYAAALWEKRKKNMPGFHRKRHLRARLSDAISGEQLFNKMSFVLFASAVAGIGLIFSGSRGGMIAAAAGLLLISILFLLRQSRRRKGLIVLALFLIISLYAIAIGVEAPLSRFETMYGSMEMRERFWRQALRLFHDYPVVGSGIGVFQYAYPKYQSPADTRRFIEFAHNDWIQFLSEAGVVGMILLVGGISFYLLRAFRIWRDRHDGFAVCLGIAPFAALAAMGIHSWSDFNLHIPANFLMLLAIMAIGHSAVHLQNPHRTKAVPHRFVPLKYKGVVFLLFLAFAVLWSSIWSLRHGIGETFYYSSRAADTKKSVEEAVGLLESANAWSPLNAEYLFNLVSALQKVRYEKILDRDRENRNMGEPRIIGALEDAVRLNPLHEEAHIQLSWEYIYLWGGPDSKQKWIPAADLSMERGAFFAGENNPYLHFRMGDYWLLRSKTVSPADPQWEAMLARARWHFQKNLALETGNDRKKMVEQIRRNVWMHYPHVHFVRRMIEE